MPLPRAAPTFAAAHRGLRLHRRPSACQRNWLTSAFATLANPIPSFGALVKLTEVPPYVRWFAATLCRQFVVRGCAAAAAGLTFTTLIAVVPFVAVVYRVLSLMPLFEDTGDVITTFIFENFVAGSSDIVLDKVREFSANANELTLAGVIALFVTTMLLVRSVEHAFNAIWGVTNRGRGVARLLTYWGVVCIGVPLIGAAVVAASYDFGLSFLANLGSFGLSRFVGVWLPPIATCATFALFYYAMPNTRVRVIHAVAGGVVTAALFEGAKAAFAAIVPILNQQLIYGAFAALPLMLMGLYLLWVLVLAGAVFVRILGLAPPTAATDAPPPLLVRCMDVLRLLRDAHLRGETVADATIDENTVLSPGERDRIFAALAATGLVRRTHDGSWLLGRNLREVTLWDLYQRLPEGLLDAAGDAPLTARLQAFAQHARVELGMPLEDALER